SRLPFAMCAGAENRFPILRRRGAYSDQLSQMASVLEADHMKLWAREYYDYMYTEERTLHYLDMIGREQSGDILIVDGQFGLLHAGKSALDLDHELQHPEFQLGLLEGAC